MDYNNDNNNNNNNNNDLEVKFKCLNQFIYKNLNEFYKKNNKECSICLESYSDNDEVVVFNCLSHVYHKKCLYKWFVVEKNENCPLCRKDVLNQ